jgi:hypothetical protein
MFLVSNPVNVCSDKSATSQQQCDLTILCCQRLFSCTRFHAATLDWNTAQPPSLPGAVHVMGIPGALATEKSTVQITFATEKSTFQITFATEKSTSQITFAIEKSTFQITDVRGRGLTARLVRPRSVQQPKQISSPNLPVAFCFF